MFHNLDTSATARRRPHFAASLKVINANFLAGSARTMSGDAQLSEEHLKDVNALACARVADAECAGVPFITVKDFWEWFMAARKTGTALACLKARADAASTIIMQPLPLPLCTDPDNALAASTSTTPTTREQKRQTDAVKSKTQRQKVAAAQKRRLEHTEAWNLNFQKSGGDTRAALGVCSSLKNTSAEC